MSTLSDWQVGFPTLIGVYKRKELDGDVGWQYWTGKFWGLWFSSLAECLSDTHIERKEKSIFQEGS